MEPQEMSSRRGSSAYTAEQLNARALARSRRAAMRRRAGRIRRSVAALAVALFTAAFLGVYVQLASGHDPALSAAGKSTASSTPSASTEASTSSGSSSQESSGASSSSSTEASTPSSVTTSQS